MRFTTPRSRRAATAAALSLGLLASACSGSGSGNGGGGVAAPGTLRALAKPIAASALGFKVSLQTAERCDALLDYLHDAAEARVGAFGLPGLGGGIVALEGRASDAKSAATSSAAGRAVPNAASAPVAGTDYSTTNVQELGIDEPDLVKTDGTRMVVLAQGRLSVVDLTGTPRVVGTLDLNGDQQSQPTDLLLDGARALVLGSTQWTSSGADDTTSSGISAPGISSSVATVLTDVDLSNPATPSVRATLTVAGEYVTARQVGDVARVVLRSSPTELPFVTPQSRAGEARAKASNQQVVRESTLADWLPSYQLVDATGATTTGQLTDCNRVSVPTEFAGFGSASVLTFDLTKPLDKGSAASVLGSVDTVYASSERMYLATASWVDPEVQGDAAVVRRLDTSFATSIHAFSIAGATPARYVASGSVDGHLLNQFSLSESNDVLRVAATKGAPWGNGTESTITTLRIDGQQLALLGQVGGLGKGERIYAVRFLGDVAYVVTFRQTDPFYTVDLRDPAHPTVRGELKLPGYSGYLHPIDATHVLGVGASATDAGRVTGAKVTLFDVSNLDAPKEVSSWSLPGGSSTATFDHHAFLYWAPKGIAVLPVQQYNIPTPVITPTTTVVPGGNSSSGSTGAAVAPSVAPTTAFVGAIVLHVDASGLSEVGRISQTTRQGVYNCPKNGDCPPSVAGPTPIERTLVAAGQLWSVTAVQLQANALDGLAVAATLPL